MTYTGTDGTLRIFSFGGGVQSTAALVLAAKAEIDFRTFVFANVGSDSENPATLDYIRDYAAPFARENGLDLHEVHRERRTGEQMTLYQHVMSTRFKGVQLPVRLSTGPPARRHCTTDYKIAVLRKWERSHGASAANPAWVGIGISWDEIQRMRTNEDGDRIVVYPLIDLRLTRWDCEQIIRGAGLPVPPRSKCWFCPYTTQSDWQHMRHAQPELFKRAVNMEDHMSAKMAAEGEGPITFHSKGPLLVITSNTVQRSLFDEPGDVCEGGYCMT